MSYHLFSLYVDDIVVTSNDDRLLQIFIDALGRGFEIKDLSNLHYFLGLQVTSQNKGVHISQLKYTYDLLVKHDMLLSKSISTLMSAKAILTSNDGAFFPNPSVFQEIIGSLQYLTITRPDITFAVNSIAQFMSQPRIPHLITAKCILRYIKGLLDHGLFFSPQPHPTYLIAYVDANWAGCSNSRHSTSSYLGTNLVSWCSKKLPTIIVLKPDPVVDPV